MHVAGQQGIDSMQQVARYTARAAASASPSPCASDVPGFPGHAMPVYWPSNQCNSSYTRSLATRERFSFSALHRSILGFQPNKLVSKRKVQHLRHKQRRRRRQTTTSSSFASAHASIHGEKDSLIPSLSFALICFSTTRSIERLTSTNQLTMDDEKSQKLVRA